MRKFLVLSALLLFSAVGTLAVGNCDGLNSCYVRAAAGGTGTGASWTNACTDFTGACALNTTAARGTTYWVATGSYSSLSVSAADTGTTPITINGVTTSSHGSAGDWNNAFAGQAVFSGQSSITTDYVSINGQTRGSDWQSGYTIKFTLNGQASTGFVIGRSGSSTLTNWTLDYVEIEGSHAVGDAYASNGFQCYPTCNNIRIAHSWLHHVGVDIVSMGYGGNSGSPHTYEYDWFAYAGYSRLSGGHFQAIDDTGSNVTVRYSLFQNIINSGVLTDASGGTPTFSNRYFYGNIVFWDAAFASDLSATFGGNGIVGFFGETFSGTAAFYNNTIVGFNLTNTRTCVISPGFNFPAIIQNNLWEHTTNCNPSQIGDYATLGAGSGTSGSGSNTQTATSTEFLSNWSAFSIAGFGLSSNTNAGNTLSSPYNADMLGVTRGANGTWNRGALQIPSASSSQPPAAPQSLLVVNVQ